MEYFNQILHTNTFQHIRAYGIVIYRLSLFQG